MWVTKAKLNINHRKLRREANVQKTCPSKFKDNMKGIFNCSCPDQQEWDNQEPNVIKYHLTSLPGARGKGLFPSCEERMFLFLSEESVVEKSVSTTVFHCPGIVEHFAWKSHPLCTLLLLILVLLFLALSSYFHFQQIVLISTHDHSLFCSPLEGGGGGMFCGFLSSGSTKPGNTIPKPLHCTRKKEAANRC